MPVSSPLPRRTTRWEIWSECTYNNKDLFDTWQLNSNYFHFRQLLKDPKVIFTGYKIPHPLQHEFVLRIQTSPDYSPQEALMNAIKDLISEIALLEERFRVSYLITTNSIANVTHWRYLNKVIWFDDNFATTYLHAFALFPKGCNYQRPLFGAIGDKVNEMERECWTQSSYIYCVR